MPYSLILSFTAFTTIAHAGPKPTILLTTFEPFQGPTNSSQSVAAELAKLNTSESAYTYEVCALPTEYDRSFNVAKSCYDQARPKPSMVLSLGEATDKLKIETRAKNRDDDIFPDNAGVKRQNAIIEPRGPAEVAMTLPIEQMLCASEQFGRARVGTFVTPSAAMQNYVCNNLAFRMARYLKPLGVPFGFMHVPDQNVFTYAETPAQVAERIDRMVKVAVLPKSNPARTPECRRGPLERSAQATLASLGRTCRDQVRHRLAELAKVAAGTPSEEDY